MQNASCPDVSGRGKDNGTPVANILRITFAIRFLVGSRLREVPLRVSKNAESSVALHVLLFLYEALFLFFTIIQMGTPNRGLREGEEPSGE